VVLVIAGVFSWLSDSWALAADEDSGNIRD